MVLDTSSIFVSSSSVLSEARIADQHIVAIARKR